MSVESVFFYVCHEQSSVQIHFNQKIDIGIGMNRNESNSRLGDSISNRTSVVQAIHFNEEWPRYRRLNASFDIYLLNEMYFQEKPFLCDILFLLSLLNVYEAHTYVLHLNECTMYRVS